MNISTADAMIRMGGISRSSLWKWYADCRVALTASKQPAVAWNVAALDRRQKELQRAQKRIAKAA